MSAPVIDLDYVRDRIDDDKPVWLAVIVECPVCDEHHSAAVHDGGTRERLECTACGAMYGRVTRVDADCEGNEIKDTLAEAHARAEESLWLLLHVERHFA